MPKRTTNTTNYPSSSSSSSTIYTAKKTMADSSIPLAYGTAVPMAAPTAPVMADGRPTLTSAATGRSARVLLPSQEAQPLSQSAMSVLKEQGFTTGLAESLNVNKRAFPLSIWVVDNSGSMATNDGHRIVEQTGRNSNAGNLKFVQCSRWREMQQTVDYHAQMAALLQSPTTFRMLNDPGRVAGPQQFSIADKGLDQASIDSDLAVAQQVMLNAQPGGVTPLVAHLHEIRDNVAALAPELRNNGTKVAIVLATDGLPTDTAGYSNARVKQQFVDALRQLEGLPVWVVVRLCTDEDEVVEYWNNLDSQLELSLEVLDDFVAEAAEVYECNKWLTYGLPLHRMRELGYHHRIFDLLDERKLSKDELRDFFRIMFGPGPMDEAPDPEGNWKGFCETVSRLLEKERKVYNPHSKRMEPWIDMKKLNKEFGHGGFFGMFG